MDRLQKAVSLAAEKRSRIMGESPSSVERKFDLKNLERKVITDEALTKNLIYSGLSDKTPESKAFKMLRTKVLSEMRANNWKTIAVSTPSYGQGKSTIVANLAVAVSMEIGQSVLAIDLDLTRPNLGRIFDLSVDTGLSDVLLSDKDVLDLLVNTNIERLTLGLGKGVAANSSELLSSPKFQQLLEELKKLEEQVIVFYDLPPLLDTDDVLKSISYFDCSLLVFEDGVNTAEQIDESIQIMKKTNFLGYIINKSRRSLNIDSLQKS